MNLFIDEEMDISLRWLAPESLGSNKCIVLSKKTDVYSYGMVLYEIITKGSMPFKGYLYNLKCVLSF